MGKPDMLSWRLDHGKGASNNEDVVLLQPELIAVRALEGLHLEGPERDMLREICQGNQRGEQEEPVTKAARELWQASSKMVHYVEWSEEDGVLWFRGKIYVPRNSDLQRQVVLLCHDTKVARHPRRWKTLELVSRNYWWPQMSRYIGQYISTCNLCLRTKPIRQAPVGKLHPLRIPDLRWDMLSVDFVVELPLSSGHDAVITVVDSVSKRTYFILTHTTMTVEGAARLFLHQVWKLHSLLKCVVSDRGPQFVAHFTRELYRLLGIKLVSSTAWHPQTDGQTERVNQELDQYLRLFVNEQQDDWYNLLPMAEFQHNNHVHSATQQPPFLLDTRRIPRMGFEPQQNHSDLETVNEFTERMRMAIEEVKSTIRKAQEDMKRYYDQCRTPALVFNPGDKVFLNASDIQTMRPSQKLSHRRLSPFVVERRIEPMAYRLKLPYRMKQLHPVFNVVKLTLAPDDPITGRKTEDHPLPIVIDGEAEWEVEEILDSHWHQRRFQYLIKWKGYGREHNSWESASEVFAPELTAEFHRKHSGVTPYKSLGKLSDILHLNNRNNQLER